jgi:hypothetical protein
LGKRVERGWSEADSEHTQWCCMLLLVNDNRGGGRWTSTFCSNNKLSNGGCMLKKLANLCLAFKLTWKILRIFLRHKNSQ